MSFAVLALGGVALLVAVVAVVGLVFVLTRSKN